MTALTIIACLLLLCVLIGRIRIGAKAEYSDKGLFVWITAGPFTVQIIHAGSPEKTKKKRADKQIAVDLTQKKSRKDTISMALKFLPLVGETAGLLKRKIQIDDFVLRVIWGNSDPAAAAAGYGAGNAVVGTLWPIIASNFYVKRYDLHVDVDFDRESPVLTAKAKATLMVGQGISLAFRLGIKALKIYQEIQRENTQDEAVQA